jgi:hypothetical protein
MNWNSFGRISFERGHCRRADEASINTEHGRDDGYIFVQVGPDMMAR